MLVTQVRVGDKVGSLVFYSPGKPSVAHINFLTELVAIQVQRLEGAG